MSWKYLCASILVAGNGNYGAASGDGGLASSATFNWISSFALDSSGDVYIADYYNHRIRKVTPNGIVQTVAGGNTPGFADGPAAGSLLDSPLSVAVDT